MENRNKKYNKDINNIKIKKVEKNIKYKLIFSFLILFACLNIYLAFNNIYAVDFFKTISEENIEKEEDIDIKKKGNLFSPKDVNVFYEGNLTYVIPSKNIGEEKYEDISVPILFSQEDGGIVFSFQDNLKNPDKSLKYVKEETEEKDLDYNYIGELKYVKNIFSKDLSNLNNISRETKSMLNLGLSKMFLNETDENLKNLKKDAFLKEVFGEEITRIKEKLGDTDIYLAFQLYIWDIVEKKDRNFSKLKQISIEDSDEKETKLDDDEIKYIKKIYEYLIEVSNANKEYDNSYKRPNMKYDGEKEITDTNLKLKNVALNISDSMRDGILDLEVLMYSKIQNTYVSVPKDKMKLAFNEEKPFNIDEIKKVAKENIGRDFFLDILIDKKYIEENFGKEEKIENLDLSRIKLNLRYKYLANIPVVYKAEREEYKSVVNVLKNNDEYNICVNLVYKQNDLRLNVGLEKINNVNISGRVIEDKNIDPSNLLNLANPEGKNTDFVLNISNNRLEVLPEDNLIFNIKGINEGDTPGYIKDVLIKIPDMLEIDLNDEENVKYEWRKLKDNIYVSSYLKNKRIDPAERQKGEEDTYIMKFSDENLKFKCKIKKDAENLKTLDVIAKIANAGFENEEENLSFAENENKEDVLLEDIVENLDEKNENQDEKKVSEDIKKEEGKEEKLNLSNIDRDSKFLKEDEYVKYFEEEKYIKELEDFKDDISKEELIINEKSDLALKIYAEEKNGEKIKSLDISKDINTENLKNKENENGSDLNAKYNLSKEDIKVKEGETVKFKLCIFNEGDVDEVAEKVSIYVPKNMYFDPNSNINLKEGWFVDGEYISTEKLKDVVIKKPFKGNGKLNLVRHEIELELVIENSKKDEKNIKFNILGEIKGQKRSDRDSWSNIDFSTLTEKEVNETLDKIKALEKEDEAKKEEAKKNINKDSLEYKLLEDDTDFETFILEEEKRDLALRIKTLTVGERNAQNRNEKTMDNVDVSEIYNKDKEKLKEGKDFLNGQIKYNSPKDPIKINQNERVTYEISMFNEGLEEVNGEGVRVIIPPYLEFVPSDKSSVNQKYGWKIDEDNPKIIWTDYLKDKKIKGLSSSNEKTVDRGIIELELISSKMVEDEMQVVIAEIDKGENGDKDSTPGNLNLEYATKNYSKFIEEYMFNLQNVDLTENKYFKALEDDDDFESVVLKKESLDLSLKMFLTGINNEKIEEEPEVNISKIYKSNEDAYKISKNSKNVKNGDMIKNKIRIYNEGEKAGAPIGINIYIPAGMGYLMENKTNIKNLWKIESSGQPEYLSKYTGEKLNENGKNIFEVDSDDPLIIKGPVTLRRTEIKAVGEKPYELIPPLDSMKDIYYLDYEVSTIILEKNQMVGNEINAKKFNLNSEYISEHSEGEEPAQENQNGNQNTNQITNQNNKENELNNKLIMFAEISETFSEDGSTDKDSVAGNFSKDTFNFLHKEDDTDFLTFDLEGSSVDLFLKMGVNRIWQEGTSRSLSYNRIDVQDNIKLNEKIKNNEVDKAPLEISEKDKAEFKIRVYNKGNVPVFVKQISIYIPEELEYDIDSEINQNTKYKTYTIDGVPTRQKDQIRMLKTNILSYEELSNLGRNTPLSAYDGKGELSYHEISLVLKSKENLEEKKSESNENKKEEEKLKKVESFKVYSEIDEVTDIYGNFLKDAFSNYGSFKTNETETLQIIEDDTDYEVFKKIDFFLSSKMNLQGIGITKRGKKGVLEYVKKDFENKKKTLNLPLSEIKKSENFELIYNIDVENKGMIPGNITKLLVNMPDNFNPSFKNRIFWENLNKDEIQTSELSNIQINPGDIKSLNLILEADIKNIDNANLNASSNILKTYNEYGIENIEKADSENESKINIKILDIRNEIFYPVIILITTIILIYILNIILIKIKKQKEINTMELIS